MSGRTTSSRAGCKQPLPRYRTIKHSTPAAPPTRSQPTEPLLQRKYQELIRRHLDKLLDKLLAEFTGLHFHVAWAPAPNHEWPARTLPTGCSVCCRLSGDPLQPECRRCGPRQLARVLAANEKGRHFTCRLGVRNFWFAIRIRHDTLGIAYLQALDHTPSRRPGRKRSARATAPRQRRPGAVVMSRGEFTRAAKLLQLIVAHAQTASVADLQRADLTNAGHVVVALEKEQARLHQALKQHLPPTPPAPHRARPESHPEQLVHRLLECIEQNYARPVTLRHCAVKLGMNAAYLSAVFSRVVGVPFKTYLTERRLEKARGLLGDSAKNISDVAAAVGYASENRFRIAFKKATGLSPKLWRETMQTKPPAVMS